MRDICSYIKSTCKGQIKGIFICRGFEGGWISGVRGLQYLQFFSRQSGLWACFAF